MKTWWILFGCTLGLGVVLTTILLLPEPANSHGQTHPDYAPMLRGGDGGQRHGGLLLAGWVYGALQIGLFVAALSLGLRPGKGRITLAVGGVAYLTAITLIIAGYAREITSDTTHLVYGFPFSTALMLFVLWPLPCYFVAMYILKFDSWILSPEDRDKFAALCERVRRDRDASESQG